MQIWVIFYSTPPDVIYGSPLTRRCFFLEIKQNGAPSDDEVDAAVHDEKRAELIVSPLLWLRQTRKRGLFYSGGFFCHDMISSLGNGIVEARIYTAS